MPISLQRLEQEGRQRLLDGGLDVDQYLNGKKDDRAGLSLIAHPAPGVVGHMQSFLRELQRIDPNQYYYKSEQVHITVLSIISCVAGFSLDGIDVVDYYKIIADALTHEPAFEINFEGIAITPVALISKAKGDLGPLDRIREKVRSAFKSSGLRHSIDSRYILTGAHLTLARFKSQPVNSTAFLSLIDQYRSVDFGKSIIDRMELVLNDWYHTENRSQVLGHVILNGPSDIC